MGMIGDAARRLGCQRPGLLLVGHGTRDARGVAEFLAVAELVDQRLPGVLVRPCFLELAEPSIDATITEMMSGEIDVLVVVPVLLFAAGHAKQDIPRAIEASLRGHEEIPYIQAPHLGTHAQMIALSASRYQQATSQLAPVAADETMLLLVGRGSRDRAATAEMREFSQLRQHLGALPHVAIAFFAMAEPGLEATMRELRQQPFRRIVVQPHLLFQGQILDQIADLVREADRQTPDQGWVVCEHLGPSACLADALVDRFLEALQAAGPRDDAPSIDDPTRS